MANGDIYQVIDKGYNNDQVNLNVYFFRRDSIVADVGLDAQTLAENFIAEFLPLVCDIQNTSFLHTEVQVKNLFDPTDAFVALIAEPGTYTWVDEVPTFLSIDVALEHDNAAVRQGRKAYGGFEESHLSSGVIAGAGFIANLALLMAGLEDPILYGLVDTFFPVVVQRILDGSTYRLPANAGEAVYGGINAATYNPLASTQNSRKAGVGI